MATMSSPLALALLSPLAGSPAQDSIQPEDPAGHLRRTSEWTSAADARTQVVGIPGAPAETAAPCGGGSLTVEQGLELVAIALSGLDAIERRVQTAKRLVYAAAGGTWTQRELALLDQSFQTLVEGVDFVAKNTSYYRIHPLDNTSEVTACVQVGGGVPIPIKLYDLQAATLGLDALDLLTPENAADSIDDMSSALWSIAMARFLLERAQLLLLQALAREG